MSSDEDNNNWCIDLDGLCLADDPKLIEAEEEITPRGRAIEQSEQEEDVEAQRPARRSVSRERKHAESARPSKSYDNDDKKKKQKQRSSSKTKEDSPKKTLGLPFNLSFTGDKKSKTKTQIDAPEEKSSKNSKEVATDSDSDETTYTGRNTARNIQADVFMISGCEDSQTSADVSNVDSFSLPDPNGRAGGACTSALLKVLYSNQTEVSDLTFVQVLTKMRKILKSGRYSQIPQLTSAKQMDVSQRFYIVPPSCQGTKRAVLIGINYVGQSGELSGCHNDCLNMKDYIMNVWGFEEKNITVLMDDGYHTRPTYTNIINAYKQIASQSQDGDAAFCHYSGHGGRVRDDDYGEEADGYDETLVPVDYTSAGQIRDDDLYTSLVCAMASGVTLVSLMDCCHSATVLDLPYKYRSTSSGDFQLDPLALDGGNAMITCFVCAVIVIILVILLPIMLANN